MILTPLPWLAGALFNRYILMQTINISTSATKASTVWDALDKVKQDLHTFSEEHNVSETLMLCCLKTWAERQLMSDV